MTVKFKAVSLLICLSSIIQASNTLLRSVGNGKINQQRSGVGGKVVKLPVRNANKSKPDVLEQKTLARGIASDEQQTARSVVVSSRPVVSPVSSDSSVGTFQHSSVDDNERLYKEKDVKDIVSSALQMQRQHFENAVKTAGISEQNNIVRTNKPLIVATNGQKNLFGKIGDGESVRAKDSLAALERDQQEVAVKNDRQGLFGKIGDEQQASWLNALKSGSDKNRHESVYVNNSLMPVVESAQDKLTRQTRDFLIFLTTLPDELARNIAIKQQVQRMKLNHPDESEKFLSLLEELKPNFVQLKQPDVEQKTTWLDVLNASSKAFVMGAQKAKDTYHKFTASLSKNNASYEDSHDFEYDSSSDDRLSSSHDHEVTVLEAEKNNDLYRFDQEKHDKDHNNDEYDIDFSGEQFSHKL